MQNKLKSVTVRSINELNDANIRTIMATGDNMLTALSVGRKCGIVKDEQTVYMGDIIIVNEKEALVWKRESN
jgi:cation-transporting ATPase 13A3/4/5